MSAEETLVVAIGLVDRCNGSNVVREPGRGWCCNKIAGIRAE